LCLEVSEQLSSRPPLHPFPITRVEIQVYIDKGVQSGVSSSFCEYPSFDFRSSPYPWQGLAVEIFYSSHLRLSGRGTFRIIAQLRNDGSNGRVHKIAGSKQTVLVVTIQKLWHRGRRVSHIQEVLQVVQAPLNLIVSP